MPEDAEALLQNRSVPMASEIPEKFERALKASPSDQPILLILDTLEEMILAQKEVLLKLIELIERAYKACPQLRLLLAGAWRQ